MKSSIHQQSSFSYDTTKTQEKTEVNPCRLDRKNDRYFSMTTAAYK
ncbi:MAG: hypothetical protein SPF99_05205 [Anaerobutyricum sp.]|nr:hypothetical protein [Anaerobutyricum sp.]